MVYLLSYLKTMTKVQKFGEGRFWAAWLLLLRPGATPSTTPDPPRWDKDLNKPFPLIPRKESLSPWMKMASKVARSLSLASFVVIRVDSWSRYWTWSSLMDIFRDCRREALVASKNSVSAASLWAADPEVEELCIISHQVRSAKIRFFKVGSFHKYVGYILIL